MIDLKPFCGDDFSRYYLQEPWSEGAYTYATNGVILVRVARRDDVPETDATRFVNAAYLFRRSEGSGFVPLPHFDLPAAETVACPACDGSGRVHACCDCGHTCEACNGGGSVSSYEKISVGIFGTPYNAKYAALLRDLPGIAVATNEKPLATPLHFKFDGGEGLLMPLSGSYLTHVEAQSAH